MTRNTTGQYIPSSTWTSLNGRDFRTVENMQTSFKQILKEQAKHNGVTLQETTPDAMFHELILKLHENSGDVVILLDEYDKPILGNISKGNCSDFLDALNVFYSVIKEKSSMLRLAFVTGVSKFCHVSLFSELNNLTDITLNQDYAEMLGFTEAEVRKYYAGRMPAAAKANGIGEGELMKHLMEWYDGYRFSRADTHVCNPVSITKFFANAYGFSNCWDETGTPSFLLELMGRQSYDHEAALKEWYGEGVFSAYELNRLDITGLLWQTGYLTIKDVRQGISGMRYRLDFPDREVKETFMNRLLEFYAGVAKGVSGSIVEAFYDAIWADDLDGFMKAFQSFLASVRYDLHIPNEKYYQTIFFIVFELLGIFIEAESCTNQGRIDAYIRTAKTVYIFEFKLDRSTGQAISQILDRHYYEKFQGGKLPIRLIGVNFDSGKGRIDGWEEATL